MINLKTVAFKDGTVSLDVRVSVEDGTIWLSTAEMAKLFMRNESTVRRHIKATYNELSEQVRSGCAKNARTLCKDGKYYNIPIYNEQIIKAVAERLNSDKYNELLNYLKNSTGKSENKDNLIIYNNGSISLDVTISPEEDTVWLSQAQIALLFETTQQNVSLHIKNILEEGELYYDSVHKDFLYTASDDKQYFTSFYNLDLILAVGYRIKGKRAIEFRKWVSSVLKKYLIKGYAINESRAESYSEIILNIEKETLKLRREFESLKQDLTNGLAKEKIFYDGQIFDAHEHLCSIVRQANKNIRIIDPFLNDKALDILSKSRNVERYVYLTNPSLLSKKDIKSFKNQYGHLEVKYIKKFHDRFIIIDDKDCYSIGTSINGAGLKTFTVIKLEDEYIIRSIIELVER